MSEAARQEILSKIRRAKFRQLSELTRRPVAKSERPREAILEQFADYVADYRANVIHVDEAGLPAAIGEALRTRGSERVVVPFDLPAAWLPEGLDPSRDEGMIHRALNEMQAVVTGCAVAIAETGTIVLDAGFAQGRRAITLIPDHHVCVVRAEQVVDSVPEAVAALAESVAKGQPLTWISGPSATSDIELNRVEGVHGPRNLDVLIVG